jgi:hypothetical protein
MNNRLILNSLLLLRLKQTLTRRCQSLNMSRQHYRMMMMMILISVRSYMELILPGPACLPPGIKKSPIQNRMRRGEEKK